jgi:hypothetical protein
MAGSVIIGGKSYSGGSSIPDEVIVSSPASTSAEVRTSTNSTFRLGRQSSVRMRKRESGLLRGSALVSSGRGLVGRRSESVRAGGARIDCRGTVLMAVNGDQVKVTCLEGGANVRLTETRGQFLRLEPGTMVLLESSSGVMPDRVEVDLERLTDTAALTCTHFGELPSSRSIRKAIARQRRDIEKGKLLASDVTVSGSGGTTTVGGNSGTGQNSNSNSGSSSSSSSGGGSSSSGGGGGSAGGGGAVASAGGSLSAAAVCA